jgi:CBS domain-containing protein
MKVRDVMTAAVRTVSPDATLKEVAAMLAEHGISGMPVVDDAGTLLGVVSKTDILIKERASSGERGGLLAMLRGGDHDAATVKIEARTAAEAMTSPVIAIDPERPVAAAAAIMLDNRINRLPVVRDDALVGIVTRSDLVRAFTRTDAEIEREIHEDVVQGTFWLPDGSVAVTVSEGVVQLLGEIETRADAEMLPEVVRKVLGVVAVEANLTWRVDGQREFVRRRA